MTRTNCEPTMESGTEIGVTLNAAAQTIRELRADLATKARALAEREAECERLRGDIKAFEKMWRDGAAELRAQLIEARQDLREEEKRHRKAAVDRDDLRAQLAERDAEIGRLREQIGQAHNKVEAQDARLSELEPVAEAVRLIAAELENLAGDASEMSADRDDRIRADVRFDIARQLQEILPKKGPQP